MDLGQLNDQEKATLKKFREVVKDCKLPDSSDTFLLRWLIARDFDIPKAEKMLRACLEWRRQHRVDHVLDEFKPPEVLLKYYSAGIVGRDKQNNPLWVVRYGRTDVKGVMHSVKKKEYYYYVISLVEKSIALSKTERYSRGPNAVSQSTIIFDMDEFSMRHITYKPAMDVAIQLVQMYEANYPELLRRVFVVNAPKIFSLAYSMIKPFLHERTKNKITVFEHDRKQWAQAILQEIDAEELPVYYGGTMTDPDGNEHCITKVNRGGEIPKSYYLSNKPKSDIANKKSVSLSRGSKEHLEFDIREYSVLRWEFYSEEGDVAFAVYRKEGAELTPVVPHDRVDSHIAAEEGEIHCDTPGVYVVEFDNSFSYIRSKKIWYAISVEKTKPLYEQNGNEL